MNISALRSQTGKALRLLLAMFDLRDVFVFAGIASVFVGLWQIYPPSALIVVGSVVVWLGVRR